MNNLKICLSKAKVKYYYFRYVIASWKSERMHKKRMRALCKMDDRYQDYIRVRDTVNRMGS